MVAFLLTTEDCIKVSDVLKNITPILAFCCRPLFRTVPVQQCPQPVDWRHDSSTVQTNKLCLLIWTALLLYSNKHHFYTWYILRQTCLPSRILIVWYKCILQCFCSAPIEYVIQAINTEAWSWNDDGVLFWSFTNVFDASWWFKDWLSKDGAFHFRPSW